MVSRLGPHAILNTPQSRLWAVRAPISKGLANVAVLQAAPAYAIRVYRWPWDPAQQDQILETQDVDRVVTSISNGLAGYRHPNLYVEVLNEVGKGWINEYIDLVSAVVPHLHAIGLNVCGPSWSTGDFDEYDWGMFRASRWCGLDAISLHAYWGNLGFTEWHALRYRTYWDRARDPGLLLVTECGRDKVEGGKGGYTADELTDEAYVAELAAYDAEISRDVGVYAVTFTAGPTDDWRSFDIDPLCARLAAMTSLDPPIIPPPIPPEVPVPDNVPLSTPTRISPAFYESEQEGNYSKTPRARTIGVVIHSTGGGSSTLAAEAVSTCNWFQNRDAGVSAHRVIGPAWTATCVADDLTAYHARENNRDHLAIEFAIPDTPQFASSAWPAVYYEAGGELLARWALAYGFPLRWVSSQSQPGLICHKDSEAGKQDRKRDPTGQFDGARLVTTAQRWYVQLGGGGTVPTDPTVLRDKVHALGKQIADTAADWRAAGYPDHAEYCESQGYAVMKTMIIGKGGR